MCPNGWTYGLLEDFTCEASERLGPSNTDVPIYGVDRVLGLTPTPKYASQNLSRYKRLRPGMFAYNPMRLSIGSIGYCPQHAKPGAVSPDYVVLHCRGDRLIPEFFRYFIQSDAWKRWTAASGVGSVRIRVYFSELAKMPVCLPPLPEQRAIAAVLGALDDKIELNRRMSETLEAMARALFKSWFIDFDPVRAKMAGRDTGLPKEIADLFPDRLVDSELGEIPKGWEVRGLDEVAEFRNGLALQKFPPCEGRPTLPAIKIAQLRKGSADGADRCGHDVPSAYVIGDGDLLFSWSGTLLASFWVGGSGALNQHLFRVVPASLPASWVYFWIQEHLPWFRMIAASKATTMGHIQRMHLSVAKVVWPLAAESGSVFDPIESMMRRAIALGVECRTLASLRDTLLPKLISGELRIPDPERFLKEVAA